LKAPDFNYIKASSLEQVFTLLEQLRDEAQILAGGQSLIPMLNLRMANPKTLIDITGLHDLRDIRQSADRIIIGALTTHSEILSSRVIKQFVPLLAQAAPHVAHMAIRNSGTIGGSMALADPAAEYPAVAMALNAQIVLRGREGERRVSAEDFFQGLYKTAINPDEVLIAVEFPCYTTNQRTNFTELARRKGDYAMVGVAVNLSLQGSTVSSARVVFMAIEDKPVIAQNTMRALINQPLSTFKPQLSHEILQSLEKDISPWDDLQVTGSTKTHLAGVILGRSLHELAGQNV
jgi:aerobic carbon-monoxide dehydrogenase medium subunit